MHFSRVRSAVGARLSAVVVCVVLVAGLSACDAGGGASPTAPAAEAPTPLDGVLCDVLPTNLLSNTLGFDSYTYAYYHHPISGGGYDHSGYSYVCMLQSDYTTWAMLEIHYEPDDAIPHQIEFGPKIGSVEFDRVPASFPNAEPVDIDGQDGRGWAWAVNNAAYIFWLYPDGQSLYVNLRRANSAKPDADQQRALRTVAAVIIADVPPVAASSPSVSTMYPSPTPGPHPPAEQRRDPGQRTRSPAPSPGGERPAARTPPRPRPSATSLPSAPTWLCPGVPWEAVSPIVGSGPYVLPLYNSKNVYYCRIETADTDYSPGSAKAVAAAWRCGTDDAADEGRGIILEIRISDADRGRRNLKQDAVGIITLIEPWACGEQPVPGATATSPVNRPWPTAYPDSD